MIGQTIAHYEILEKLGEGGMGVVYKARDTRLGRLVALKLLPHDRAGDDERLRRFTQEARTASGLNHPNIITIHDIATEGSTPFIVMEFVPGLTLDQLIPKKGMRLPEILRIAAAIADALAAAASAGVIHRDIKPGNVMVSEAGHVKVLDFGLAKTTDRAGAADQATATIATRDGAILGTVFYMSPEQAEGKPLDPRSDIFSFGVMLYEMITGQRPFHGESAMSAISSILRDEPQPLVQLAPEVPRDLDKIVMRCLRKDPARRFQTMADVRVALLELKEESDSGKVPAAADRGIFGKSRRKPDWLTASGITVLAVTGYFWIAKRPAPPPLAEMQALPFTSYKGYQGYPDFSPDGNQIVFVWTGDKGGPGHLYVKMIGTETPLQLTSAPAEDYAPAWAPDGRSIAFVRRDAAVVAIHQISPLGGKERRIADIQGGSNPQWTPDGKFLIVGGTEGSSSRMYVVSVETGERRALALDASAPFGGGMLSPDGKKLAFGRLNAERLETILVELNGKLEVSGTPRVLSLPTGNNVPVDWTSDSRQILIANSPSRGAAGRLLRVAADGSSPAQAVAGVGEGVISVTVARQGNRMAYSRSFTDTNIWTIEITAPGKASAASTYLSSTRGEWIRPGAWSPDGRRLVFESDRSGERTIWVSNADGTEATPLVKGYTLFLTGSPAWSRDGKSVAFDTTKDGNAEIYVVSAEGGAPRRLTENPAVDVVPSWTWDGASLYFMSSRVGRFQIFRVPAAGGEAVQVTQNGGWGPLYSHDGKYLYYARDRGGSASLRSAEKNALLRLPAEGGAEQQVFEGVAERSWAPAAEGVWYLAFDPEKGNELRFFDFKTSRSSSVVGLPKALLTGLAMSPDGKRLLFNVIDQQSNEILLIENFR